MARSKLSLGHRTPNNQSITTPAAKPAPLPTPSIEGGRGVGGHGLYATGLEKIQIDVTEIGGPAVAVSMAAILDQLSLTEKQAVYDALAMELRNSSPADRELDMWASSLHEALVAALGTGGGGVPGPMVIRGYMKPTQQWTPIAGYMEACGFTKLKVGERLAIYRLLARSLVERCQEIARRARIPLGPKLVAQNVGDIAAIMDASFPGYAAAGALQIVALRLFSGEQHGEQE